MKDKAAASAISQLDSADQVRAALERRLPAQASVADVEKLTRELGFDCSEVTDGVMRCSSPARSGMKFVRAKWLVQFQFDNERKIGVSVEKGLIGP
jgi:hypothetical protein